MRAILCTFVILFGFMTLGHAGDVEKYKNQKRIQVPSLELSGGYTAKFGIDETQIWDAPDIYGRRPSWQDSTERPVGLSITRPLRY
jgi:hypothetical protein